MVTVVTELKKRAKRASRSTPTKAMPKLLPGAKEVADALEQEFTAAGVPVTLTWDQAAELVMLSKDTLRREARDGHLFTISLTVQRTMLTRRGLVTWMANRALKETKAVTTNRVQNRERLVARRAADKLGAR
tara:strand:+ start:1602 stop:1997 length:396 start_codon:yes stop_codon:yes gene_type:complete